MTEQEAQNLQPIKYDYQKYIKNNGLGLFIPTNQSRRIVTTGNIKLPVDGDWEEPVKEEIKEEIPLGQWGVDKTLL